MARPASITDEVRTLIEAHRRPGMSAAVLRKLIGGVVSDRTLRRYLASAPPAKIDERAAALAAGAELGAPDAAAPDDTDDLAYYVRRRNELGRALDEWQPLLGQSDKAVRAYRGLISELGAVTKTLIELRPRERVEEERLEALGIKARAAMLERVRKVALVDEGLRAKLERQRVYIEEHIDETP